MDKTHHIQTLLKPEVLDPDVWVFLSPIQTEEQTEHILAKVIHVNHTSNSLSTQHTMANKPSSLWTLMNGILQHNI